MKFRATDAYRDFTGVTFSHSPVDVVGQGEFAEVGQNFVANLEGRDVGWNTHEASVNSFQKHLNRGMGLPDWRMASSE